MEFKLFYFIVLQRVMEIILKLLIQWFSTCVCVPLVVCEGFSDGTQVTSIIILNFLYKSLGSRLFYVLFGFVSNKYILQKPAILIVL